MNTVQVKLPRWMGVFEAPWPAQAPLKPAAEVPLKSFEFTADESTRFLRSGGMVRLYAENQKLRFQVNQKNAETAGLKLSSGDMAELE